MSAHEPSTPFYAFVSSKAGYDPVRTIFLCAPVNDAATPESAKRFAVESGWQNVCEDSGSVLILPIAENGWDAAPPDMIRRIYLQSRNGFKTRSGKSIPGRNRSLWCWETMLYLVGYGDGAHFAGQTLIRYPNTFAAAALIDGVPSDFSAGDLPSDHWFVPTVHPSYAVKNREIPICLWIFSDSTDETQAVLQYFTKPAEFASPAESESIGALESAVWRSVRNPAQEIRLFENCPERNGELPGLIFRNCFESRIRWKNGPDGELTLIESRDTFYRNPRYHRRTVQANGNAYDYFVYLPKGIEPDQAAGLPLVLTIHGRGEPAWLFTAKNGWDQLADETREFVLLSPDSPENIWYLDRDGEAVCRMIEDTVKELNLDSERVYLTGFSNGGMMTREIGIRFPERFAAISPWNAPRFDTIEMRQTPAGQEPQSFGAEFASIIENFLTSGFELPCYYVYGDNDPAADLRRNWTLETILRANRCRIQPDSSAMTGFRADRVLSGTDAYPPELGYREGERFTTSQFFGENGEPTVMVTEMRDMPHGATHDVARAAWAFLKRFRRTNGEKEVRSSDY